MIYQHRFRSRFRDKMQQTVTWTYCNPVYWSTYASQIPSDIAYKRKKIEDRLKLYMLRKFKIHMKYLFRSSHFERFVLCRELQLRTTFSIALKIINVIKASKRVLVWETESSGISRLCCHFAWVSIVLLQLFPYLPRQRSVQVVSIEAYCVCVYRFANFITNLF